jgi:hypothetical protein
MYKVTPLEIGYEMLELVLEIEEPNSSACVQSVTNFHTMVLPPSSFVVDKMYCKFILFCFWDVSHTVSHLNRTYQILIRRSRVPCPGPWMSNGNNGSIFG